MPYKMKPLACNSAGMNGLSEKIIVSHYENNYGGAVNFAAASAKLVALKGV